MEITRSAVFMQCQVLACTLFYKRAYGEELVLDRVSLFSPNKKDLVVNISVFFPSTGG